MAKKELKVIAIIVTYENGQRVERNWDDIPESERTVISRTLTDRFMEAAGYIRIEQEAVPEK